MAYTGGLYIPDHLSAHAESRAQSGYRGKMNSYIVDLIEADKNGGTANDTKKPGASALVDLAKVYQPAAADALATQLRNGHNGAPINQPLVMARLLDALLEALKAGTDPETPFYLANDDLLDEVVDRALERLSQPEGAANWQLNEVPSSAKKKSQNKKTAGRTRPTHPVPRDRPA